MCLLREFYFERILTNVVVGAKCPHVRFRGPGPKLGLLLR